VRKLITLLILGVAALVTFPAVAEVSEADLAKGKMLSFERKKGNCLACHVVADGTLAGNAGPPLIAMKARFPDKNVLREQIYDARIKNPNTLMPPFGAHQILTNKELDLVLDYIYSL
jgi:sulfur-oxidizing protein SoxX